MTTPIGENEDTNSTVVPVPQGRPLGLIVEPGETWDTAVRSRTVPERRSACPSVDHKIVFLGDQSIAMKLDTAQSPSPYCDLYRLLYLRDSGIRLQYNVLRDPPRDVVRGTDDQAMKRVASDETVQLLARFDGARTIKELKQLRLRARADLVHQIQNFP